VHDLAGRTNPRSYTVEAGKVLTDEWALSTRTELGIDLEVRGPNGFFRQFRVTHPDVDQQMAGSMDVRVVTEALDGGKLQLTLHNRSPRALTAVVHMADYMNLPDRSLLVAHGTQLTSPHALSATQGWYDISVRLQDDEHFLCCFAGHVETGLPTWSDPALET
jgi:phospholipase C